MWRGCTETLLAILLWAPSDNAVTLPWKASPIQVVVGAGAKRFVGILVYITTLLSQNAPVRICTSLRNGAEPITFPPGSGMMVADSQ